MPRDDCLFPRTMTFISPFCGNVPLLGDCRLLLHLVDSISSKLPVLGSFFRFSFRDDWHG